MFKYLLPKFQIVSLRTNMAKTKFKKKSKNTREELKKISESCKRIKSSELCPALPLLMAIKNSQEFSSSSNIVSATQLPNNQEYQCSRSSTPFSGFEDSIIFHENVNQRIECLTDIARVNSIYEESENLNNTHNSVSPKQKSCVKSHSNKSSDKKLMKLDNSTSENFQCVRHTPVMTNGFKNYKPLMHEFKTNNSEIFCKKPQTAEYTKYDPVKNLPCIHGDECNLNFTQAKKQDAMNQSENHFTKLGKNFDLFDVVSAKYMNYFQGKSVVVDPNGIAGDKDKISSVTVDASNYETSCKHNQYYADTPKFDWDYYFPQVNYGYSCPDTNVRSKQKNYNCWKKNSDCFITEEHCETLISNEYRNTEKFMESESSSPNVLNPNCIKFNGFCQKLLNDSFDDNGKDNPNENCHSENNERILPPFFQTLNTPIQNPMNNKFQESLHHNSFPTFFHPYELLTKPPTPGKNLYLMQDKNPDSNREAPTFISKEKSTHNSFYQMVSHTTADDCTHDMRRLPVQGNIFNKLMQQSCTSGEFINMYRNQANQLLQDEIATIQVQFSSTNDDTESEHFESCSMSTASNDKIIEMQENLTCVKDQKNENFLIDQKLSAKIFESTNFVYEKNSDYNQLQISRRVRYIPHGDGFKEVPLTPGRDIDFSLFEHVNNAQSNDISLHDSENVEPALLPKTFLMNKLLQSIKFYRPNSDDNIDSHSDDEYMEKFKSTDYSFAESNNSYFSDSNNSNSDPVDNIFQYHVSNIIDANEKHSFKRSFENIQSNGIVTLCIQNNPSLPENLSESSKKYLTSLSEDNLSEKSCNNFLIPCVTTNNSQDAAVVEIKLLHVNGVKLHENIILPYFSQSNDNILEIQPKYTQDLATQCEVSNDTSRSIFNQIQMDNPREISESNKLILNISFDHLQSLSPISSEVILSTNQTNSNFPKNNLFSTSCLSIFVCASSSTSWPVIKMCPVKNSVISPKMSLLAMTNEQYKDINCKSDYLFENVTNNVINYNNSSSLNLKICNNISEIHEAPISIYKANNYDFANSVCEESDNSTKCMLAQNFQKACSKPNNALESSPVSLTANFGSSSLCDFTNKSQFNYGLSVQSDNYQELFEEHVSLNDSVFNSSNSFSLKLIPTPEFNFHDSPAPPELPLHMESPSATALPALVSPSTAFLKEPYVSESLIPPEPPTHSGSACSESPALYEYQAPPESLIFHFDETPMLESSSIHKPQRFHKSPKFQKCTSDCESPVKHKSSTLIQSLTHQSSGDEESSALIECSAFNESPALCESSALCEFPTLGGSQTIHKSSVPSESLMLSESSINFSSPSTIKISCQTPMELDLFLDSLPQDLTEQGNSAISMKTELTSSTPCKKFVSLSGLHDSVETNETTPIDKLCLTVNQNMDSKTVSVTEIYNCIHSETFSEIVSPLHSNNIQPNSIEINSNVEIAKDSFGKFGEEEISNNSSNICLDELVKNRNLKSVVKLSGKNLGMNKVDCSLTCENDDSYTKHPNFDHVMNELSILGSDLTVNSLGIVDIETTGLFPQLCSSRKVESYTLGKDTETPICISTKADDINIMEDLFHSEGIMHDINTSANNIIYSTISNSNSSLPHLSQSVDSMAIIDTSIKKKSCPKIFAPHRHQNVTEHEKINLGVDVAISHLPLIESHQKTLNLDVSVESLLMPDLSYSPDKLLVDLISSEIQLHPNVQYPITTTENQLPPILIDEETSSDTIGSVSASSTKKHVAEEIIQHISKTKKLPHFKSGNKVKYSVFDKGGSIKYSIKYPVDKLPENNSSFTHSHKESKLITPQSAGLVFDLEEEFNEVSCTDYNFQETNKFLGKEQQILGCNNILKELEGHFGSDVNTILDELPDEHAIQLLLKPNSTTNALCSPVNENSPATSHSTVNQIKLCSDNKSTKQNIICDAHTGSQPVSEPMNAAPNFNVHSFTAQKYKKGMSRCQLKTRIPYPINNCCLLIPNTIAEAVLKSEQMIPQILNMSAYVNAPFHQPTQRKSVVNNVSKNATNPLSPALAFNHNNFSSFLPVIPFGNPFGTLSQGYILPLFPNAFNFPNFGNNCSCSSVNHLSNKIPNPKLPLPASSFIVSENAAQKRKLGTTSNISNNGANYPSSSNKNLQSKASISDIFKKWQILHDLIARGNSYQCAVYLLKKMPIHYIS